MAKGKKGFEKGKTGNPSGRPKGAKNKVSRSVRRAFEQILENNIEALEADLSMLEPKDRLRVLVDIAKLLMPRQIKSEETIRHSDGERTLRRTLLGISEPLDLDDDYNNNGAD
jgi:hypothetical protein